VPRYGWVPADAADVRKVHAGGQTRPQGRASTKLIIILVALNRIEICALARGGRGYYLITSRARNDGPLNYFMYPYAEVNGKALDWLAGQTDLKSRSGFKRTLNEAILAKS